MMNARKKQTNRNNVSMCPFCGEFYPIGRSMSTHIRHCEQEQRNEEAVINNVNNGPRSPTTFTQLKNSFMEELRSDAHDIINGSYDLRQDHQKPEFSHSVIIGTDDSNVCSINGYFCTLCEQKISTWSKHV